MGVSTNELYEKLKEHVSLADGIGTYMLELDGSEEKVLDEIINKGLITAIRRTGDYVDYILS